MSSLANASAGSAAIGAAAGSVASQVTGNVLGVQDGFSWKAVALSAVGGGIGSGLSGVSVGTNAVVNAVVRAALTNAATQAVGVVTGLQKSFNWKGVAAAAAGGGVGQLVGDALGLPTNGLRPSDMTPGEFFAKAFVKRIAAGAVTAAARGGRVSAQQVATDAFGNAIGDSLASQSTQGQGPWSSKDYRNGSDIESDNFNPASAYGYRNGSDVESDAFRPAMAYGYRNGSDVESDNRMAARELANNRTLLNAAERAARPEAYMSIEQLPRVTVSGVSQATLENRSETQRLLNCSQALPMGADGLRIGPTVDRARAQGIYTGDIDSARFAAEYRAHVANGPQATASGWQPTPRQLTVGEQAYYSSWSYGQALNLSTVPAGVGKLAGDTAVTAGSFGLNLGQGYYSDAAVDGLSLAATLTPFGIGPATRALSSETALLKSSLQAEMRAGLLADLPGITPLEGLSPTPLGWPGRGGAGPVPGTIGITDSTSVRALQDYYPKGGGVEFVYDPTTNRFAA